MKKGLFLFLTLLFFISCNQQPGKNRQFDQNPDGQTEKFLAKSFTQPKDLKTIKARFSEIENARKNGDIDTISIPYNCNNARSGQVTYYSEDDQILLIEHRYNEYSHHEASDWFYLYEEQPFFVFLDRLDWSFDGQSGGEIQTKDNVTQSRLYFLDGNTIQCLEKKFERRSDAPTSEADVPNMETDCSRASEVLSDFKKLWNSRNSKSSNNFCKDI